MATELGTKHCTVGGNEIRDVCPDEIPIFLSLFLWKEVVKKDAHPRNKKQKAVFSLASCQRVTPD